MKRFLFLILVIFITAIFLLLLSGKRILVFEKVVYPGESFLIKDYGDLGKENNPSLVCKYFTGRSITTSVFWFSPNNHLGNDECPFLRSSGN